MTTTDDAVSTRLPHRLLRSSARLSYDPEVDLDWDAPLVEGLWFMQPERLSLYGTPLWESLDQARRLELTRHEVASIASVGIWFEMVLLRLLARELYDADARTPRTQYALTELGDECRHSVMFGKAIAACGTPAYGPVAPVRRLGRIFSTVASGAGAYAAILVAEELLDRWQRELMRDERVQPLIRMVSRVHVLEEARHMTFAREEVARAVPRLSRTALAWHRSLAAQSALMVARTLVNPAVYAAVGLDPREARRQALANPHYRRTLAWMGERAVGFLEEQRMIGPAERPLWRRSMLLPG